MTVSMERERTLTLLEITSDTEDEKVGGEEVTVGRESPFHKDIGEVCFTGLPLLCLLAAGPVLIKNLSNVTCFFLCCITFQK